MSAGININIITISVAKSQLLIASLHSELLLLLSLVVHVQFLRNRHRPIPQLLNRLDLCLF